MSFFKKKYTCLTLSLTVLFFLGILWWLKAATIESFEKPVYNTFADKANMRNQTANVAYLKTKPNLNIIDTIQLATYDPSIVESDRTIFIENTNWTGISSSNTGYGDYSLAEITTDILNEDPNQKINWSNVYMDGKKNKDDLITALKLPDVSATITDVCSTKGFLYSDYTDDFCVKHAGDTAAIDEKCQKLSAENCKIPSCCVLINGNKCMVGNQNGPTFVPENGKETDYTYYYNKDTCYGNCAMAQSYASACDNYTNHSTGISKACMIQMFNNYGCPNSNPDGLINDAMVQAYGKTTKQYVDNYIKNTIITLRAANTSDGANLCYGE
jgi:hypothetical protein